MSALQVYFIVLLQFVGCSAVVSNDLEVTITPDGSYSLAFKTGSSKDYWFLSGPLMVMSNDKMYSSEDGSLKIDSYNVYNFSRHTDIGYLVDYEWTWSSPDGEVKVSTEIDVYYTDASYQTTVPIVVFQMGINLPLHNKNGNVSGIQASYPSFKPLAGEFAGGRGWMTYSGNMAAQMKFGVLGKDPVYGGLDGGMPVAFFENYAGKTMVMSPLDSFMDVNQATWTTSKGESVIGFGPIGSFKQISGYGYYPYKTIVAAGSGGIVDTIQHWGSAMTDYNFKRSQRDKDFTIHHLGYWTDNGACYYYYSEPYANYQEAMLAVNSYAVEQGIPFRYLQLDSWWYFQGEGHGVKNWTAMPSVFPDGIQSVVTKTGWPIVAHNRYWSKDTDYAMQNGGKFNFHIGESIALPNSSAFWDYLLSSSKDEWNLAVYEQDWLDFTETFLKATYEVSGYASDWLSAMGRAANSNGLTIQYCMAWPRHYLYSVLVDAVTQIRVSDDYHPGNTQWMIGDTTILAEALGLSAFKDTFHTVSEQKKCKFSDPEPYPELETVSAALSGGPVGIGDAVGTMNKQLIMSTCMVDGRLLKPSRPAMSLDSTIIQRTFGSGGPEGELWASYTVVNGSIFYMIFAADIKNDYDLSLYSLPQPANITKVDYFMAYQFRFDGKIEKVEKAEYDLKIPSCGRKDFQYWVLAPKISDSVVFLGEMSKVIAVSTTRFKSIVYQSSGVTVVVRGVPAEPVTMAAVVNKETKYFTCMIGSSGMATLKLPGGVCS